MVWGNAFAPYPVVAARAVCNTHRAERSTDDPDLRAVVEKLRVWREDHPPAPESRRIERRGSPSRTIEERCDRYSVGGKEAWVIDGFDPDHWHAMERVMAMHDRGEPVSLWTTLRFMLRGPVAAKLSDGVDERSEVVPA